MHSDKYTVINLHDCLQTKNENIIGEDELQQILSDFSCPLNQDVERFLKGQAIEFVKKNQSVTYLVFSNTDATLVGYFTLTIKPITVDSQKFSKTVQRKLLRVSERNEVDNLFHLSAYLIAQLGKNYTNGANKKITGEQLMEIAIMQVRKLQYMVGGMVVFLETEKKIG